MASKDVLQTSYFVFGRETAVEKNEKIKRMGAADDLLRRYWGHRALRPIQREVVESVLSGCDTLAVLPTGGGKSVCYQIPALSLPGLTIVVSPLIALMQDQVEALQGKGIAAAYVNSSLSWSEQLVRLEAAAEGKLKLLYVAPERIATESFIRTAQAFDVSLIAVDEAHCISGWGHDFRPAYRNIVRLRELFSAPVVALTATATPRTAADICRSLSFRPDFRVVRESLRRENLAYQVRENEASADRLIDLLREVSPGSAIVYCATRADVLSTARMLEQNGFSPLQYHAGLNAAVRSRALQRWMDGCGSIMVATSAFGMGIDKPDVRLVVHRYLPPSPEEYFQQAGRAGRDGLPARAVILYDRKTVADLRRRSAAAPEPRRVMAVYRRLCAGFAIAEGEKPEETHRFAFSDFAAAIDMPAEEIRSAFDLLVRAGVLTFFDRESPVPRVRILASPAECRMWPDERAFRVLEALARSCDGVFGYACDFDVEVSAALAELSVEDFLSVLSDLSVRKVVEYVPAGKYRTLCFNLPRNDRQIALLLKKTTEDDSARRKERAEKMEQYLYAGTCRARWIETYFGEYRPDDCHRCDNCMGNKRLFSSVEEALASGPSTAKEIAQAIGKNLQETISELRISMDAGRVVFDGRGRFRLSVPGK